MQPKTIDQVIEEARTLGAEIPEMDDYMKSIAGLFYKMGRLDATSETLNSMELGQ